MAPPLLTVRSGAVVASFHDRALAEAWLGDNLRPFQDCSVKCSRDGSVQGAPQRPYPKAMTVAQCITEKCHQQSQSSG